MSEIEQIVTGIDRFGCQCQEAEYTDTEVYRVPVQQALDWQNGKRTLREALVDEAFGSAPWLQEAERRVEDAGGDYWSAHCLKVRVDGPDFVVYLASLSVAEGETPLEPAGQTTIVAFIAEGVVGECYPPGIYRALHEPGIDPLAAIRAAAQEFVGTPEGQGYVKTDVGGDCFNWGDAVVAIPRETLARHGVWELEAEDLGRVRVVDHDERIA